MNPFCQLNGLKYHPSSGFLLGLLLIGGSPLTHGQTAESTSTTAGSSVGKTNTIDVTVTSERTAAEKTDSSSLDSSAR